MLAAAAPLAAHHSFAAEFDDQKPVKGHRRRHRSGMAESARVVLRGYERQCGKVTNWGFAGGAPGQLMRRGITNKAIKPGMTIAVEGFRARTVRISFRRTRDFHGWPERIHRRLGRSHASTRKVVRRNYEDLRFRFRRRAACRNGGQTPCSGAVGNFRSAAPAFQPPRTRRASRISWDLPMAQAAGGRRDRPLRRPSSTANISPRSRKAGKPSSNRAPATRATTSRAISACPRVFPAACSRAMPCSCFRRRITS